MDEKIGLKLKMCKEKLLPYKNMIEGVHKKCEPQLLELFSCMNKSCEEYNTDDKIVLLVVHLNMIEDYLNYLTKTYGYSKEALVYAMCGIKDREFTKKDIGEE